MKVCTRTLQKYGYKTTICREGSQTLRRLLDLELAQQGRPVDQGDLTQIITSMARLPELESQEHTVDENGQWLWPALVVDQASSLVGDDMNPLPTIASSSVPGMVGGVDQPDAYWLMDNIIFSGY